MLNVNNVIITGRLSRDAESKTTQSGLLICNFTVAVSNPRKDKNGEWHDDTVFMDCTAFDKTAERADGLPKGQQVCVEGKLKQENWEKDGSKRSKILIAVSSVKPFETAKKGDSGDSSGGYSRKKEPRASDALNFGGEGDDSDDIGF